ncbi:uncharacterized protein LOC127791976 isoform X2 [Diospyros lotus]|uniref:uncharacterized protein LOC127791976 isoform X2 n=1 Tax=Diospyros lotus TaxID=55363 RepID=UPI00224E0C6D|nr:uncharacterized protein LOC127791976 isoform X2 [Diospyros lotus]
MGDGRKLKREEPEREHAAEESRTNAVREMSSEAEVIEQRLNSFLGQLQVEFGILDRVVYKNKNQHRRCSYFQYLIRVRRDLRLLQSVHLEEILSSSFLVLHGTRPRQKVQLLESLKRRKCNGGKYNFLEQLLGAARLLSQMVEPILKAATEISTLLARSFFMGFSLTVLALLARVRVLVQQILLDVVKVFNMVSSFSQQHHSVKLAQEGFEVFREYYPTKQQTVLLDCEWEKDKFILRERICGNKTMSGDRDTGEVPLGTSGIQYQSIEAMLGDDVCWKPDLSCIPEEGSAQIKANNTSLEGPVDDNRVENCVGVEEGSAMAQSPSETKTLACEIGLPTGLSSSPSSCPLKTESGSRNKVAFVSVNKPATSTATANVKVAFVSVNKPATSTATANVTGIPVEGTESQIKDEEDPFFSLLTGGNMKSSLF